MTTVKDTSAPNDQAKGPLNGLRVIDLTQFVLGPYATQTLGDLGADVIKIEEPSGDRQRHSGKPPNAKEMGPTYVALNRNKRSVALDLKTDPDKEILRKLVATGDIFIHNMRPAAVARLGFSYADVKAIRPDIIYVEAMGYEVKRSPMSFPFAAPHGITTWDESLQGGADPQRDGYVGMIPLRS